MTQQYAAATKIGQAEVQIGNYPVVQKTIYREEESGKFYYTTIRNMRHPQMYCKGEVA